ncbi:MAG: UDP-N-acetylmuramate dehydrogenase [Candidatus Eisenbacteria bacterium]
MNIPEHWQRDVPLTRLTSWRIGGTAAFLAHPRDWQQLHADCELAARCDLPVFAIGAGSNLLFPETGYPGLLVRLPSGAVTAIDGRPVPPAHPAAAVERPGQSPAARPEESAGTLVRCPGGFPLSRLVRHAARLGWAGLEWAEGIPGTVGGAIVNNAGAFGGEIGAVLESVEILTPPEAPRTLPAAQLDLAYRTSRLKGSEPTRLFLLSGCFHLAPGRPDALGARMAEIRTLRRRNAPREPSCGSVFRNPPGHPAGRLIEEAGLSGMRIGDAQVSTRHANYIVNRGRATAREVLELISIIRQRVRAHCGIELELEVQPVGFGSEATAF